MKRQTLLLGLDGATFTVLDPLMRDGVMPFLKELVATGARAPLRTIIPALTPPAWTSLMTGRSPGQHGIFDFFRRTAPDSQHMRFNTSHDVAVETIWAMANRYGRRAIVLNFPLMFPPPAIVGSVVSGWMPWRQLRHGCYPPDLYDRLKALPGFEPRELAMDMGLEEKALEGCDASEHAEWVRLHTRREEHWLQILRYLMREDPAELTAVLFDGVDKLQHLFWRYLDPALATVPLSAAEEQVRQGCLDYFRRLDGALAEIVELAGANATVIVASDHGFGPQTGTFFVNTWLQQHGYLAWADENAALTAEPDKLGIGQLARHVYLLDWAHTTAYASTPSTNGIHIVVDKGDGVGVPPAEYEHFRQKLTAELLELKDPQTGASVVSRAWTREEAFAGPFMELAPDLTLVLNDGGLISILASDTAYKVRPQPSGTHRPDGIFIAAGPGIRQGALTQLSILDVAPVVLNSLGLPIPVELEGRIPMEMFEDPKTVNQPAEDAAPGAEATPPQPEAPVGPTLTPEDEAELLRRLRALGYVA